MEELEAVRKKEERRKRRAETEVERQKQAEIEAAKAAQEAFEKAQGDREARILLAAQDIIARKKKEKQNTKHKIHMWHTCMLQNNSL